MVKMMEIVKRTLVFTLVKMMETAKRTTLSRRAKMTLGLVGYLWPTSMLTRWVRKLAPIEASTMFEPQNLSFQNVLQRYYSFIYRVSKKNGI